MSPSSVQRIFEQIALISVLAVFWISAAVWLGLVSWRTIESWLWIFCVTLVISGILLWIFAWQRWPRRPRRTERMRHHDMRSDAERLATRNGYTYEEEHADDI